MPAQLIDIGVNLMHRSFAPDREAVVRRAAEAGVTTLIITGTSERNSREGAAYAATAPGRLYSTAGVHPHDARNCTEQTIAALEALCGRPEVVAVGECGLDFNRDFSPRPLQERWFEAQLELAARVGKPLFLHERDAHQRFVEVLNKHRDRLARAVVHCFTGSAAELKRYLELDLYIGITGWICDERRGKHLRDLVGSIPLDRLMIETDAPFLTPRTMLQRPADGRNEPAFLPYVLRAVAEAHRCPADEVAAATTATARAFFDLA